MNSIYTRDIYCHFCGSRMRSMFEGYKCFNHHFRVRYKDLSGYHSQSFYYLNYEIIFNFCQDETPLNFMIGDNRLAKIVLHLDNHPQISPENIDHKLKNLLMLI